MTGSPSSSDSHAPARETPGAAIPAWKDEIAARVRAHRSRTPAHQPTLPGLEEVSSPDAIAARVAERYSRLPSWRQALAAEAAGRGVRSGVTDALVAPQWVHMSSSHLCRLYAAPGVPQTAPVPMGLAAVCSVSHPPLPFCAEVSSVPS